MAGRYASTDDLLLGDMLTRSEDALRFVNSAADEMDAVLGGLYELPIDLNVAPDHIVLRLRNINALMASGRFILAQAIHSEDNSLHSYGRSLLNEGRSMLEAIRSGAIQLTGIPKVAPQGGPEGSGNAPVLLGGDTVSGVDTFYEWSSTSRYPGSLDSGPAWRPTG